MRTLVLNQTNLVPDGQNNKLVYSFPNSVKFSKAFLAVSSISMYYSWFNISTALNNNTFSYTWVAGGTTTTYTIVVPDGLYEIATLNQLLQFNFLANGHYLTETTSGQITYYGEFLVNPSRYAVQLNTYLVPNALPAGYTAPAGFVFPTQSFNPSFVFPVNINALLGFVANFTSDQNTNNAFVAPVGSQFVSKNSLGTISYLSTVSPNVQPNASILISSSGVNNPYAQPTSIIYSVTPAVAVGEIVTEKPPEFMWNELIDGTYNEIRLTILGSNLAPIKINDPSITIVLVIAQEDEVKSFSSGSK
jgi:hypothetical protein